MGRLFFILSLLILDSLNQAPLTKGVSLLIVFIQFQERLVEEIDFFHKLKFSNPHNFVKFLTFYILWLIILLEFIFETSKVYKIGTWQAKIFGLKIQTQCGKNLIYFLLKIALNDKKNIYSSDFHNDRGAAKKICCLSNIIFGHSTR